MQLTFKTCSNCSHWSYYKKVVDGVLAAQCDQHGYVNANLGISPKVTKGSDSCSKWGPIAGAGAGSA